MIAATSRRVELIFREGKMPAVLHVEIRTDWRLKSLNKKNGDVIKKKEGIFYLSCTSSGLTIFLLVSFCFLCILE